MVDTIVKASDEAGVDPVYMMALADKESSFDTDAKAATSSAAGLFQFVARTWLEMIRDYGARYGLAEEAAAVKGRGSAITVAGSMRARVLGLRNDPRVAPHGGRADQARPRADRGAGRARAHHDRAVPSPISSAPRAPGASCRSPPRSPTRSPGREFRSAARANRSLFTEKAGGKRRSLTVAELHGRLDDMIDRRLTRYQGVAAVAEALDKAGGRGRRGVQQVGRNAGTRRVEVTEALPPDGV